MSEDRSRILTLLAEGKITAEEAERLLDALDTRTATAGAAGATGASQVAALRDAIKGDPTPLIEALPKFLYVKVNAENGDNVDVKIPIALVRSGLKLTSLIPSKAMPPSGRRSGEPGFSTVAMIASAARTGSPGCVPL